MSNESKQNNGKGLVSYDLGAGTILEMVQIPTGNYIMGSKSIELESPQHEVNITQFWLGKYAVTQKQWKIVAKTFPKVNKELNPEPSFFKGEERPVEQVSWYESVEFCDRLSQKFGRSFRLPSESEWEYACRAGSTASFYFGEDETELGKSAWYSANSFNQTQPVGQKEPNAWGLYDMVGNAWEWTQDVWHYTYDNAPQDGSAWIDDGDNDNRLLRGGSWNAFPRSCRCAFRNRLFPDYGAFYYGFRVACS